MTSEGRLLTLSSIEGTINKLTIPTTIFQLNIESIVSINKNTVSKLDIKEIIKPYK